MPASFLHSSSRPNFEDRALVIERGDHLIVVVADGAGGISGGAVAGDALIEAARAFVLDDTANLGETERWIRVLREVDRALAQTMAGETTGVVVVVSPDGLVGVSAGDSACWLISGTGMDDLTAGQRKARLGTGRATPVSFERGRVEGALAVGTDGLFKYVTVERIVDAVREFESAEAGEALVELARLPSGGFHDEVAVVVVRLDLPTAS